MTIKTWVNLLMWVQAANVVVALYLFLDTRHNAAPFPLIHAIPVLSKGVSKFLPV